MAEKRKENRDLLVHSPASIYHPEAPGAGMIEAESRLEELLEVLRGFGMKFSTQSLHLLTQMREALKRGVPRSAFDQLRSDLGLSVEELAEVLLISPRTLARRRDRFKQDESERLLRLGAVVQHAQDVFEGKEAARNWLTRPKRALGGLTPLRCCDSEFGAREVEALLGRLEHGVFS